MIVEAAVELRAAFLDEPVQDRPHESVLGVDQSRDHDLLDHDAIVGAGQDLAQAGIGARIPV